jgi:chaperonin GroES
LTYADAYTESYDPEVLPFTAGAGSGVGRLQKAVRARDDVSGELFESDIARIGQDVVDHWNRDLASNAEWRKKAEEALKSAAQDPVEGKDYPWTQAANVRYPLLTIAGLQFASRAVPAIIKGDEAVKVKTFGKDPQSKKQERANRVAEYLNWVLFYKVDGWEADTDAMLHRLPSVGQHYRKVYWDVTEAKPCIESVSALRLTIPADARSLKSSPRITHDFHLYPNEIESRMRAGLFRRLKDDDSLKPTGDDDQAARLILEQHCFLDLDDDGMSEPYIVTVDHTTAQVLRIEEAFGDDDVDVDDEGTIIGFRRWCPFVDYGFIPDPKGRA